MSACGGCNSAPCLCPRDPRDAALVTWQEATTFGDDGLLDWQPPVALAVTSTDDLARVLSQRGYVAVQLVSAPAWVRAWWGMEVLRHRCRLCAADIGPVLHDRHRCSMDRLTRERVADAEIERVEGSL